MQSIKRWYHELLALRTVEALNKNGIKAYYVATVEEAKEMVLRMIPEGAKVGFGGSLTLYELGLTKTLDNENYQLLTPPGPVPIDTKTQQRREALTCDYYLTGTNAITADGQIVNIDGTGNRVASMVFGPKQVIVISGVNKITRNLEEALVRVREEAAVLNAKQLKRKTPCTITGKCEDCDSVERICKITTIIHRKPSKTEMTVIIIGEELGL